MLWRVTFYTDGALQNFAKSQNQVRYEIINNPGEEVHIQYSGDTGQIIGPYIFNNSNFQLNYERDSRILEPIKAVIFHKSVRHAEQVL